MMGTGPSGDASWGCPLRGHLFFRHRVHGGVSVSISSKGEIDEWATLFWTCIKIAKALKDFHGEDKFLITTGF